MIIGICREEIEWLAKRRLRRTSNAIFRPFTVHSSLVFNFYSVPVYARAAAGCVFTTFCSKQRTLERAVFQTLQTALDCRSISVAFGLWNHVAFD
jgi:hypothetical protein